MADAFVGLLLMELKHAKPAWRPTAEALSVFASRLQGVSPLALERAIEEWILRPTGFAPSVGELLASVRVSEAWLRGREQERRSFLANGLSRQRIADAVEVLADPDATVPSVLDPAKRHARWSAKDISGAHAVLGEHRLTVAQAQALLAEPLPALPTVDEQARAVAARSRRRLGLDAPTAARG